MDKKEFPNFFEQVKNLSKLAGDVARDVATGEEVFVSEEIKQSRLELCYSCSHYEEDSKRCRACGCFLDYKTSVKSATCPIMKW